VLLHLLRALRPKQWTKNVLIFAGLFFDGRILDPQKFTRAAAAFVIFCFVSSAIYLINDVVDADKDRLHPKKRERPIASGALDSRLAVLAAIILLGVCLPLAFVLHSSFGITCVIYVVVMLAYDFFLKHVVIVDVMTIAAGFVLRVFAGTTVVIVTRFSPWLYVCTTLGALFIAINKRRHELLLLAQDANDHRSSLQEYSVAFLDEMTSLVTATTLTSYSLYTFSAPNLPANHTMMLTIPFVIYGLFRYLYLIHAKSLGGNPEDIVLSDRPLLICFMLWSLAAGLVIYGPSLF
jgi:4-hydroxybenzoate polyprenyltransferase